MKRVFSFEKWFNDPLVIEFIETQKQFDKDIDKWIHHMEKLDGKRVDKVVGHMCFVGDNPMHIDWTEEVESDSVWHTLLLAGGLALAVYGLAILSTNLGTFLCSLVN